MILKRLSGWVSQIGLFLILSIVLGLSGAGLISVKWGVYGATFGLFASILVAHFSENLISWIYGASPTGVSPGLSRYLKELNHSKRDAMGRPPRILIYPNPIPQFLMARGLFCSKGTLILSQGLMSSLREEELRILLRQAIKMLPKMQTCFLSYDTVVLLILLRVIPAGWVDLLLSQRRLTPTEEKSLTPLNFAAFSVVFPTIRVLVRFVMELNNRLFQGEAEGDFKLVLRKTQNSMGPWQNSLCLMNRLGSLAEISVAIGNKSI